MSRQRIGWLGAVGIFVALAAIVFAVSWLRTERAPAHALRVGVLRHESTLPVFIAESRKLFAKHGLTVEIVELPPGDHLPALLADRVDVISPTSFPALFGIMRHHPATLYALLPGAEVVDGPAVYGLVVSADFQGNTISDLKHKTIMAINPYTKVNIQTILFKAGLPREDWPDIRVADRQLALNAVSNKTAQAAILDQPALATALASGEFRLLERNPRAKYIGSPYWSGAGAVKTSVWKSREREMRELLAAIDEAIAVIRADPNEAHRVLADRLGLDPKIAEHCGGYYFPTSHEEVPIRGIADTVDALVQAGLLETAVSLDHFFPMGVYGQEQ